MVIENFNYSVSHCNKTETIVVSVKVGNFSFSYDDLLFHFRPQFSNEIHIDLNSGKLKNENDSFTFFTSDSQMKSFNLQFLLDNLIGFEFELEQAYEKALFYRSIERII